MSDLFVTPAWLQSHLASVVPVEASFYLPDEGKDADALFRAGHIPGAVRFDIDVIANKSIPLPHMLPDAPTFASMVGALGLSEDVTIVVYDSSDLLGGARAWWMLKHYGAKHVHILDGGYKAWLASGGSVETGEAHRPAATFIAQFDDSTVVDAGKVLAAATAGSSQIVDARGAPRFEGKVAEPRPGLRSGHIPTSRNVPFRKIIDESGRLRPQADIASAFAEAGVDVDQAIITTCGSGVSAAVLILGLKQLGKTGVSLYDGSWSEWGGRHDLPIESGPAAT